MTSCVAASGGLFGPPLGSLTFDDDKDLQAAIAAAWSTWPAIGSSEEQEPSLPVWQEVGEQLDHRGTLFAFHTEACADFQRGYCSLHRNKGKASPCFRYHFESQHRRPPVDPGSGSLLYWDVPCHSMTSGAPCAMGDPCVFAHSREEISYHPAKYKTRRCNGRGCRGEAICCFAHSEAELRVWAPERYSYWTRVSGPVDWTTTGGSDTEDWRRAPAACRGQLPAARHKQRFCASYPDVAQCRRGSACAFAHSREEAKTPLLSLQQEQQVPTALTEEFFMYQFKTLWCPIGVQHDWQTCVYAHNYQDARRRVSIGYGPRPCPYWAKKDPTADYSQRCPLGLRCPFSHGAKEQLYHPQYFRTVICRDLRAKACPREKLCAFFHRRAERRKPPADATNYSVPLKEEALPEDWVTDFLTPPFRDALLMAGAMDAMEFGEGGSLDTAAAYWCAAYGGDLTQDGDFNGEDVLGTSFDDSDLLDECYSGIIQRTPATPKRGEEVFEADGTPRTQTGDSDPADDSSTSTMRGITGRAERAPGAGAVGLHAQFGDSPWKVPAPSCGPFGGPFDAFPGFLALASELGASSGGSRLGSAGIPVDEPNTAH